MREITPKPIAQFAAMVTAEAALAITISGGLIASLASEVYRGIVHVVVAIALFYVFAIAVFRLLQKIAPVPTGEIPRHGVGEDRAFLYTLHYLMLFNPLIFSRTMPVPLMRLVLQALGAKFGRNAYSSGIVMDPQFVQVGDDSIIGNSAMIIPHVIEGEKLAFHPVLIGKRVTIGARAIIMADVTIEDDATVAIQSVVRKGTRIGAGEIWAGTPAKCIRIRGGHQLSDASG
ncbi:MAG: acyltransferase [Rhodocyclaceae bacterium]|nr:acyltransferase [Rhodocyclaceae bacterium]